MQSNNRRVVPPPQPQHGPGDESRDLGHRLQCAHLGHCLAGDAHGAGQPRITAPMPCGSVCGLENCSSYSRSWHDRWQPRDENGRHAPGDEGMRHDVGQLKAASLFGLGCSVAIAVAR